MAAPEEEKHIPEQQCSRWPESSPAAHGNNIASTFLRATSVFVSGQPRFTTVGRQENHYNYSSADRSPGQQVLNLLEKHIVHEALYDSSVRSPQTGCHPGTREKVMGMIMDWVDDTDSASHTLWLYGAAGVGKSAIAQTIADRLLVTDKLAASFFFSRRIPSCNTARLLFATLAWQLAASIPQLMAYIDKALTKDPLLTTKSIEVQFDRLIVEPFEEMARGGGTDYISRRVVVIDGIDECNEADRYSAEEMQTRLLRIVEGAAMEKRIPLRFLICSRPELHIRKTLKPNIPPLGIVERNRIFRSTLGNMQVLAPERPKQRLTRISHYLRGWSQTRHYIRSPSRWRLSAALHYVREYGKALGSKLGRGWLLTDQLEKRILPIFRYLQGWIQAFLDVFRLVISRELWSLLLTRDLKDTHFLVTDHGEDNTKFDQITSGGSVSYIAIGPSAEFQHDAQKYLKDMLTSIARERDISPDPWLSDDRVDALVKISCGQFLYASTIIRFISDSDSHPREVLEDVLGLRPSGSSPYPDLDRLYFEVLNRQRDQRFITNLLALLVLFSEDNLFASMHRRRSNIHVVNALLGLEEDAIFAKLRSMHSLLNISPDFIGVHHASFFEFLRDRARSGRYHINHRVALMTFLKFLTTATARYTFQVLWRSRLNDYDRTNCESLLEMVDSTYVSIWALSHMGDVTWGVGIVYILTHYLIFNRALELQAP